MSYLAGQKTTASGLQQLDPATYPRMQYYQSSAQSNLTSGTGTLIQCQTKVIDTHSAYSLSTWLYTVPTAGWYRVGGMIPWGSSTLSRIARLVQNGTPSSLLIDSDIAGASTVTTKFSDSVLCAAGDTLGLQGVQSSGGGLAPVVGGGFNACFSIVFERLP